MSDREILHCYFPDALPGKEGEAAAKAISYRQAFWQIGKAHGMTENQIQAEWIKQGSR